jgi:hypothetical protein
MERRISDLVEISEPRSPCFFVCPQMRKEGHAFMNKTRIDTRFRHLAIDWHDNPAKRQRKKNARG